MNAITILKRGHGLFINLSEDAFDNEYWDNKKRGNIC